jgi:zinc protease
MRKMILLSLVTLGAILSNALLSNAFALELKTEKYTLKNGMTVILHEDSSTPKVTVNFLVKVGSKDEPDRRSGFAHLFEHLMFMGTKRVPQGEYDKILESYGGDNNAFTAPDMTLYYSSAPARALPTMLWLEADRLEALGENIDQKKLDLQRSVVLNERRQNVENTPYGEAEEAINQLIYPSTHPYHRGTIGSPTDLNAASVEDVKAFFATYYVPNNISLLVAGNFKTGEVKPQIEKLFGSLSRKNDVPRKSIPVMPSLGTKRVTYVDRVSEPKLYMVWRIPAQGSDAFNKLDVATTVLQTRLNEALVDEGIANEIGIYVNGGILESTLNLTATPGDKVDLKSLEQKIDGVIATFNQKGITAAELKSAVAANESAKLGGLQDIVQRGQAMNIDAFYFNDPNYSLKSLTDYAKFTPKSITQIAAKFMPSNNRLIMTVLPKGKDSPEARDTRPPDTADLAFGFPKSTEFKLSNDIPVTYWQAGKFPTSFINVVSNQGSGSETTFGSTKLLTAFLDRGGKTANFDRNVQALGAQIQSSNDTRQTVIALKSLSRNLEPATKLLTEAITNPLMDADEFKNEQSGLVQDRESLSDNPRSLSLEVAYNVYYGKDHPLGRFLAASQAKKLSLGDVKKRYGETINPANLRIFAAGDQSATQLKAILEKTIGAWKVAPKPLPNLNVPTPPIQAARLIFIDRPDSPQTMIRIFTPAIGLSSPDALRYNTLGTVLGGTFTSRLMSNLREDKGYTYGISAGYIFDQQFGLLNTRSSVQVKNTGDSIKEILKEMTGIQTGITDAETQKATQTQIADTLGVFASPETLVGSSTSLNALGRNTNDLQKDYATLKTLSTSDTNSIAKKSVDLEHAIWVMVGDKKTVLPQLEGLGLPKPEEFAIPE